MLLILICLFLNYDLFHCGKIRKFPARSYKRLPPAQMEDTTEHDTDAFLKKIRAEIEMAESARRAMDADLNFGFGLEDYNVAPMDVFDNPENNHTVQRNLPDMTEDIKEPDLRVDPKEEFMNYDITQMFWTGTPKIGHTEKYTVPESFIPTPEGFQLTTESLTTTTPPSTPDRWQNFGNLPGMETSAAPGLSVSYDPNHLPEYPDHILEGTAAFPPLESSLPFIIPSELEPSTPFTRPSFPFSVPPVSTLAFDIDIGHTFDPVSPTAFTWITFPDMPPLNPTSGVPEETDILTINSTIIDSYPKLNKEILPWPNSTWSPPTLLSSPSFRVGSAGPEVLSKPKNKSAWMKFKPGIDKSLMDLLSINVSEDGSRDFQPKEGRTLFEPEPKIHQKLWSKLFVNESPKPTVAGSTQVVFLERVKTPGVRGFSDVSPSSAVPLEYNLTNMNFEGLIQNASSLNASTISGPNKKYYYMMHRLHEGYLGLFLVEFTRVLSEKQEQHVKEVILPLELILKGYEQGSLSAWFDALNNTAAIKAILSKAHEVFLERRRYLADDVNAVIDFVNSFYNNQEGEYLFNTLRDLERYPKPPGTDMDLCRNILIAVIDPIHKKTTKPEGSHLKSLIIGLTTARGLRRMSYQHLLKLPEPGTLYGKQADSPPDETTILIPSSIYNQIYSLKQRMEMKRRRKNLTRRVVGTAGVLLAQQTRQPSEQPRLRSMLPITRNQKRFRVITKRQRTVTNSANIDRPTRNDQFRKSGRVLHPYNNMMQFFPQIPKEYLRHAF